MCRTVGYVVQAVASELVQPRTTAPAAIPCNPDTVFLPSWLPTGLKCLGEAQQYQRDQDKLSSLKPADPEHEDQLLLRRLLLLRADPLARVDVREAVKAAVAKVGKHGAWGFSDGKAPLHSTKY